jgi:hypothetical protein
MIFVVTVRDEKACSLSTAITAGVKSNKTKLQATKL